MPDLETLWLLMGRRSFPKWWQEAKGIGQRKDFAQASRSATNQQQGNKARLSTVAKARSLPAQNIHQANRSVLLTTPNVANTEELSTTVRPPNDSQGSKNPTHKYNRGPGNLRPPILGPSSSSNMIQSQQPVRSSYTSLPKILPSSSLSYLTISIPLKYPNSLHCSVTPPLPTTKSKVKLPLTFRQPTSSQQQSRHSGDVGGKGEKKVEDGTAIGDGKERGSGDINTRHVEDVFDLLGPVE